MLDSPEAWQGLRYGYEHAFDGADIVVGTDGVWTATIESLTAVVPRILLRREPQPSTRKSSKHDVGWLGPAEPLVGTTPSIIQLDDALGLVYRTVVEDDGSIVLFRRFDLGSHRWGPAIHGRRCPRRCAMS